MIVGAVAVAVVGCAHGTNSAGTSSSFSPPPKPVDPLLEQFSNAMNAAGLKPTSSNKSIPPMGEEYDRELDTCKRLREGEYDAFDLQTFGVTKQNEQGRIISVAIPILCPDQQPALDLARTGQAKQGHFGDGSYAVSMEPKILANVQPGTYTIKNTPVYNCYWERGDGQGNILDNRFVSVGTNVTVTILPSDGTFVSKGCGTWVRVD